MTDTTASLPSDCTLSYVVYAEAWYRDAHRAVDDHDYIGVMAAADEGGVAWEFEVTDRSDVAPSTIQVNIYNDAFDALTQIPAFFDALAEQQPGSLAEVRAILDEIGAEDITVRVSPYAKPATAVHGSEG